jgi:hypothetical protein
MRVVGWLDVEWLCDGCEWWVDVECFLVDFLVDFFFLVDLVVPELPEPDGWPGLVPFVVGLGGFVGVGVGVGVGGAGVEVVGGGVVVVVGGGVLGGGVGGAGVEVVGGGGAGVEVVGGGVVGGAGVGVVAVPEPGSVVGGVVGGVVADVVVGVVAADAVEAADSDPMTVRPAASAMAWRRTYRVSEGPVVGRRRRATSASLRTGAPSATAGRPSALRENSARGNSTISIGTSKLARHRTGATACRPAGRPRRTPPDASWLVRTPARSTIRWAPAGVPTAASSRPATSSTAALSLSGA